MLNFHSRMVDIHCQRMTSLSGMAIFNLTHQFILKLNPVAWFAILKYHWRYLSQIPLETLLFPVLIIVEYTYPWNPTLEIVDNCK